MTPGSTIWIVTRAHDVLAAFTLEHEMVAWLRKRSNLFNTYVQRAPDGGAMAEELVPADKFLA